MSWLSTFDLDEPMIDFETVLPDTESMLNKDCSSENILY